MTDDLLAAIRKAYRLLLDYRFHGNRPSLWEAEKVLKEALLAAEKDEG